MDDHGEGRPNAENPPAVDEVDRDVILKRRNRFIAVALAGMATAATACGDDGSPMPCLDFAVDAGDQDAEPQVCLSTIIDSGFDSGFDAGFDAGLDDAGRDAAIDAAVDAGSDAGPDAGTDAGPDDGGGPMPCLSIALPDGGFGGDSGAA